MTVLIVDDDVSVAMAAARVLSGYKCGVAFTLAEGRRMCRAEHPLVVVLDERLGSARGSDAIASLRAACEGVQVILWTGYATAELAHRAIGAGAYAVVAKGDPAALRTVVQEAIVYATTRLRAA